MDLQVNKTYTRQEISEIVGGGSVHDYLPNKDGVVLCACLSQKYDPRGKQVILVGLGPLVQQEGNLFCAQKTAVPVFFKKLANLWEYVGNFKVSSWTEEPEKISEFEESSGRTNLTKVIFLDECK